MIVFNKMPDIKKKNVDTVSGKGTIIFKMDEIKELHGAWTECPFLGEEGQAQLETLFRVKKLKKKCQSVTTFLIDVNEKTEGNKVFSKMSE